MCQAFIFAYACSEVSCSHVGIAEPRACKNNLPLFCALSAVFVAATDHLERGIEGMSLVCFHRSFIAEYVISSVLLLSFHKILLLLFTLVFLFD